MCETIISGLVAESGAPTVLHVWVMARTKEEAETYRRLASSQIVRVK
jgi:hypothetical protein